MKSGVSSHFSGSYTTGESSPDLAIIVPTFNERANVPELIHRLRSALQNIDWEVVFVDDDSPDGTSDAVRAFASKDSRIRVIQRIGRRGLSTACIEGMLATSAPFIAIMDGDLQHDESILPVMLDKIQAEHLDLVVGTRNGCGGSMGSFNASRVLISRIGQRIGTLICGSAITDPMSGFFLLTQRLFLESVNRLDGRGFKLLMDIVASSTRKLRIGEVGYRFRSREAGKSKLTARVGLEYVSMVLRSLLLQYWNHRRSLSKVLHNRKTPRSLGHPAPTLSSRK